MKRLYYLHLPILMLFVISSLYFFDFTAEDAYISYRYAENFVNLGSLVFNIGEPINAMTSPLHIMLSSLLFFLTSRTVLSNKILGVALLVASALLVAHRFRRSPDIQALALSLILLPPCILLWTFGGLETPVLLFLVTATVVFVDASSEFTPKLLYGFFFLAGMGFLTRYDSILFFAPIMVYVAIKAGSLRHVCIAFITGALLPALWIAISIIYYGDMFPTSFYVKIARYGPSFATLLKNGKYVWSYLLFVGIVPALFINLILPGPKSTALQMFSRNIRERWWLWIGILLELMYGLVAATTHMMFSFRLFVPYIPATTIALVEWTREILEGHDGAPGRNSALKASRQPGRTATAVVVFLLCQLLFQAYQVMYTYNNSLNGIASTGEYRSEGVRHYLSFMDTLRKEAEDIKQHWASVKGERDRRPRIHTFAEGMLPYSFQETYVYGALVSYRHDLAPVASRLLSSDYVHILAPLHGTVSEQLPKPPEAFTLISSYQQYFDGSVQSFLVYYNSNPEDNTLQARINDPP